jgi:PPK2 family polyphosphate:nucleotide phosphotransferase
VRVASFKAPTQVELDHDYLWRVHRETPARGEVVLFNRSHYEDILVVRVHNLVPPAVWRKRFAQINDFERMLAEEGTTILKFFLHISRSEQKKRLESRLKDPTKNWKFDAGDLRERAHWNDYVKAYEELLGRTSTPWAPWHIIPSDYKWCRNVAVASIIVGALKKLRMRFPKPRQPLDGIVVR